MLSQCPKVQLALKSKSEKPLKGIVDLEIESIEKIFGTKISDKYNIILGQKIFGQKWSGKRSCDCRETK